MAASTKRTSPGVLQINVPDNLKKEAETANFLDQSVKAFVINKIADLCKKIEAENQSFLTRPTDTETVNRSIASLKISLGVDESLKKAGTSDQKLALGIFQKAMDQLQAISQEKGAGQAFFSDTLPLRSPADRLAPPPPASWKPKDSVRSFERMGTDDQKEWLKNLHNVEDGELDLSHCQVLTVEILRELLIKRGPKLEVLDLSYCDGITKECLGDIQSNCKNLQELYLSHCKNLDKLKSYEKISVRKFFSSKSGVNTLRRKTPFVLDNLKILEISNCESLSEIRIVAKKLEKITADGNANLKKVRISAGQPPIQSFKGAASGFSLEVSILPAEKDIQLKDRNPELPLDQRMMGWLEEIKKTQPKILFVIQSFIKSNQNKDVRFQYIRTLLPQEIQLIIGEHIGQFCQFLIDLALSAPSIEDKTSISQQVFATRRTFQADSFDSLKFSEESRQEPVPIPIDKEVDAQFETILSTIALGKQAIQDVAGKDTIVIVGATESGKSTTINYLLGCQMREERLKGNRVIIADNPVAQIGNRSISETIVPKGFPIQNSEDVFCDTPGFLDSRGSEVKIANAANIRNFLASSKSNRILLLINAHSLYAARGEGLKSSVDTLLEVFGSMEKLSKNMRSVLVGITHVKDEEEFESAKEKIKSILEDKRLGIIGFQEALVWINPLNFAARGPLLDKLQNLPRIEDPNQLFNTVLDDSDKFLISKISENFSNKIRNYWEVRKIDLIVEEYNKMSSLLCIDHDSVRSAIRDLQQKILSSVDGMILDLKSIQSKNDLNSRAETQHILKRLRVCASLDCCFPTEKNKISLKITQVEKDLQECELDLQREADGRIRDDVRFFLAESGSLMERIKAEKRRFLAAIEPNQSDLLEEISRLTSPNTLIQEVQSFFSEIQKETELRSIKYSFPATDQLEKLKKESEAQLNALIIKHVQDAKLQEYKEQFENGYVALFAASDAVITKNYKHLAQKSRTQHLKSLADSGFDKGRVTQVLSALSGLETFPDVDFKSYSDRITFLLNGIHEKAVNLQREIGVKSAEESIRSLLSKAIKPGSVVELNSDDLVELNLQFKTLFDLDKKAFDRAYKTALDFFVIEPKRKLSLVLEPVEYGDRQKFSENVNMQYTKMQQIRLLPFCFRDGEFVEATLKGIDQTIKEKEIQRRRKEISTLETAFSFDAAKFLIRQYVVSQFKEVRGQNLNPKDVKGCITFFVSRIKDFSSFEIHWKKLNYMVDHDKERYFFQQNDEFVQIRDKFAAELVAYFSFCCTYAEVLSLQEAGFSCLSRIRTEAKDLIEADYSLLMKEEIPSQKGGFTTSLCTEYRSVMGKLKTVCVNGSSIPEVKEIYQTFRKETEACKSEILRAARKKGVESIVKQLGTVGLERSFLAISDELPGLLATLKQQDPESYKSSIDNLSLSITAWLDSSELENFLAASNYTAACQTYVTLGKLQEALAEHFTINADKYRNSLLEHFEELIGKAIQEITDPGTDENYFHLEQFKNLMKVRNTLRQYGIQGRSVEEGLRKVIKDKWKQIVDNIPDNLVGQKKGAAQGHLIRISKEIVRQFAIARELSLVPTFRATMQSIFDKLNSDEAIYKLGVLLSEIVNSKSPASAVAGEVLSTFSKFQSINIKIFNEKAHGITFDAALKEFKCSDESKKTLSEMHEKFHAAYSVYVNQIVDKSFDPTSNISETKSLAKTLSESPTNLYKNRSKTVQLLARIFAQWTYQTAQTTYFSGDKDTLLQPHSTQILSIFCLLGIDDPKGIKNHLAEIKTGEGKSISLGILAIVFGLLGYRVGVACYSSYLSDRDYQAFSYLFGKEGFDVASQITYSTINKVIEGMMGTQIPDFRVSLSDFLKGNKVAKFKSQGEGRSLLLIDEVDVFFGDAFYGNTYHPVLTIHTSATEALFEYIWKHREKLLSLEINEVILKILNLKCTKELLSEYPNFQGLINREIESIMRSLRKICSDSADVHTDFIIKDNRLAQIDSVGNIVYSFRSYYISFAYLFYREIGDLKQDSNMSQFMSIYLSCARVLYSEIPNLFSLKLGLTATLGALSKKENEILDSYSFIKRSFIPTTFDKKTISEDETVVIQGKREKEYFKEIKKEIDKTIGENRACLVFFENLDYLNQFHNYLKASQRNKVNYTLPEILTEHVSDQEKSAIISRAISQYKVTLATRLYGRGTDFICRDSGLITYGGVKIILTFYPETQAEEIQIRGRACRQDDPGGIRKILLAEDLLRQELIPSMVDPNDSEKQLPNSQEYHQEKEKFDSKNRDSDTPYTWDTYLEKKRDKKVERHFEDIEKKLEKNKEGHQLSLELIKQIENSNDEQVYKILKKWN